MTATRVPVAKSPHASATAVPAVLAADTGSGAATSKWIVRTPLVLSPWYTPPDRGALTLQDSKEPVPDVFVSCNLARLDRDVH